MDSATFAAARGKRLDQNDVELRPIVDKALKKWSAKGDWYEDVVTAASVLWRELFEDSTGGADAAEEDALMAQFQAEMRKTLAKTQDPEQANATQARTITYWVSTYAANNAEIRAQRFNGHPALKWVTRHDSHVREMHVEMEGQTVKSGQTFTLPNGSHPAYPGEPVGPLDGWLNCRCLAQRVGKGKSMAGDRTAFVEEALIAAPIPADQSEIVAGEADVVDIPMATPFHGVAAPTDTPSGDGRQLAKAGFSTRNLPLPLNYQRGSDHGGDPGPAFTVGRIDAMWLDDATGLVNYAGQFVPSIPESGEAIQHVVDGTMRGVSIDVDNVVMQVADGDFADNPLTVFADWRIMAVTMVSTPAFQEASIELGPHPATLEQAPAVTAAVTSNPGTHDGPGWITDPIPTERLRRYWVAGEGRAKIGWGIPHDFYRCKALLGKYVAPQYLSGTCSNLHYEATGFWPGHAPSELAASGWVAPGIRTSTLVASALPALESAREEGFGLAEIMSIPARFAGKKSAAQVLAPGDWLKVTGVDARPISAQVVEVKTVWNGAVLTLEGEDVRARALPATIAVGVPNAGPLVASASSIDEVVELWLSSAYWRSAGVDSPIVAFAHSETEARALAAVAEIPMNAFVYTGHLTQDTPRSINLVASAEPVAHPPREWFANPNLTGPTPLTITEDGRIFATVASWGTCHIGYPGVCTTPPESFSNYAYFRTGVVDTSDGEVAVGHITMDGGHAPISLDAKRAAAHYDNTTAVVADVAAGEDGYGIWIAGALRPGVTPAQKTALKAAALSGDWRSIGGHLEMVAALAVNVPGFPIPRTSLAASGEHQESLIAAGIVTKENIMAVPPVPPAAPKGKPDSSGPPAPKAPPAAGAPATEKPHAPGDEAVKSAVETLHKGLQALETAVAGGGSSAEDAATKIQELLVTAGDLMKYLGLSDGPDATPTPEPPVDKTVVASMIRRELAVRDRRDAALATLRSARVARAKSLVR